MNSAPKDLLYGQINAAYLIRNRQRGTLQREKGLPVALALQSLPASRYPRTKPAWAWKHPAKGRIPCSRHEDHIAADVGGDGTRL